MLCKTMISIIIPTLNEAKTIGNLLKDLQNQTFSDFETIVVDAKSDDDTKDIVKKFHPALKVKIVESKTRNVSTQRNLGAISSKYDWLIFMDADNRAPSYFLQGIKFNLEMLEVDFLSTWFVSDKNSLQDKATATLMNIVIDSSQHTANPYVLESMLVAKKSSFLKLKGFDEKTQWSEGSDLLRRAYKKNMIFRVIKNPKYTYSFRRLRKLGTFKVFSDVAKIELSRIANKKISKDNIKRMYPLEGGGFYTTDIAKNKSINKMFLSLFRDSGHLSTNSDLAKKPQLVKKILDVLSRYMSKT